MQNMELPTLASSGELSDAENFFFGGRVATRQKKFFFFFFWVGEGGEMRHAP